MSPPRFVNEIIAAILALITLVALHKPVFYAPLKATLIALDHNCLARK
jgi:hypothetical protein